MDIGCFGAPPDNTCNDGIAPDFAEALKGSIGPFLRWDPSVGGAPPAGFIAATPHKVISSPTGNNVFRVEGPGVNPNASVDACPAVAGPLADCLQTDLFTVQGKVSAAPPPPAGDATAPSVPTGLTATAASSSQIDLSWTASTDNVGVTGYNVYRDGATVPVAAVSGPSYSDTGLAASSTHSYTVAAFDAVGNESGQSAAVAPPPVPTAPVQSYTAPSKVTVASPLANSTIPVWLKWSATGSVARYELQQSTNGGAFTSVALPTATATTVALDLAMGTAIPAALNSYQFQVRTCNSANACSAWVSGPDFQLAPVDDGVISPVPAAGNAMIAYSGSWQTQAVAGAYGGAVRFATQPGPRASLNKVTFRLAGNVAWVSTMGPDRGKATVSLNGGTPVTVDLYAPDQRPAQVVYVLNNLTPATHTVTVTVLGTKNAASTGTRVDIDAFAAIR